MVAYVEFDGQGDAHGRRSLKSISLRPIVLNRMGEGQPDVHSEYTNNEFLVPAGCPRRLRAREPATSSSAWPTESKPFGTALEVKGETAEIKLKSTN